MKVKIFGKFKVFAEYVKLNYIVIFLFVMFFAGIIFGSGVYLSALNNSKEMLNQFAQGLSFNGSKISSVGNCILINLIYFIFIAFSGFSLGGAYYLYIVPFIKGLTYGYISSFIYSVFGLKGLFVNLLGLLPQTIILSLIIILSCKYSIRFSMKIFKEQKIIKSKQFILSQALLFICACVISFADIFILTAVIELFI